MSEKKVKNKISYVSFSEVGGSTNGQAEEQHICEQWALGEYSNNPLELELKTIKIRFALVIQ